MHTTTVAIDLAKDVFELAFADAQGRIAVRKRLSRSAFSRCLLNLLRGMLREFGIVVPMGAAKVRRLLGLKMR